MLLLLRFLLLAAAAPLVPRGVASARASNGRWSTACTTRGGRRGSMHVQRVRAARLVADGPARRQAGERTPGQAVETALRMDAAAHPCQHPLQHCPGCCPQTGAGHRRCRIGAWACPPRACGAPSQGAFSLEPLEATRWIYCSVPSMWGCILPSSLKQKLVQPPRTVWLSTCSVFAALGMDLKRGTPHSF